MLLRHGELVVQPNAQSIVQGFVFLRQHDLQAQKFVDSRLLVVLYPSLPDGYV